MIWLYKHDSWNGDVRGCGLVLRKFKVGQDNITLIKYYDGYECDNMDIDRDHCNAANLSGELIENWPNFNFVNVWFKTTFYIFFNICTAIIL